MVLNLTPAPPPVSQTPAVAWRVRLNGQFDHTVYARTAAEAMAAETRRLGSKARTTEIKITRARS